jgi:membrane fusion protein (multidrug efflux system)
MRIRGTLCGFLLPALLAACDAGDQGKELEAPPVVIANVEVRDLEERIEATGELVAKEEAQIASEVSGRITEILVDEGEAVEAAQVLLEIDPERRNLELADARAGLTEAGAALGEQERDYRRAKTLHERGIASDGSPRMRTSIRPRRRSPWPAPAARQPAPGWVWPSARCGTPASGLRLRV